MSEIEPLSDHIASRQRAQFHNFHRKWSLESFDIQLKAMAVLPSPQSRPRSRTMPSGRRRRPIARKGN